MLLLLKKRGIVLTKTQLAMETVLIVCIMWLLDGYGGAAASENSNYLCRNFKYWARLYMFQV